MSVGPTNVKKVVLSGPVTLYTVSQVRETLQSALASGKPLQLDLGDSGPWDLAGVQLLISCAHSGASHQRDLLLLNTPSGCLDVAKRAGLSDWLAAHQA